MSESEPNKRFRVLAGPVASWKRLSPFFHASRARIALLVATSVVAGFVEASVLALIAAMAVSLSAGAPTTTMTFGPLAVDLSRNVTFVVAIVLTVTRAVLQIILAYIPAQMSSRVMADLRIQLFDAFTRSTWSVKTQERDGAFQTLMTQNVINTAQAVIGLGNGITAMILFFMMVMAALSQSFVASMVLAGAALVLFFALRPLSRKLRRHAKQLSREAMAFTGTVQEVVLIAEETEVFGATPEYVSKFHDQVNAVRYPYARTRFLSGSLPALYQSVALLMLVVALIAVSLAGFDGFAALAAVILMLIRALTYAQQMQSALTSIDERVPFMDQITSALKRYRENSQQDGSQGLGEISGLSASDVSFSYRRGVEVLQRVSFGLSKGEALGIVGPSGAGKSSIVQLLLRLREPDSGNILVNGGDVRAVKRSAWRQSVAYVPQTPQLISGTVRENICFYRGWIDEEKIQAAARRARIHDDIVSWPKGYDTQIGQRVSAISGGQRQRICLARALAGDPQILVLDEPTSALDVRSEDAVSESLQGIKQELLLVLIAHRLSTLSVCDRIVVMVNGEVAAVGSHRDLMEQSDFFREVNEITRRQDGRPTETEGK